MVRLIVRVLCGRGWGSVPWWGGYGKMRVLCGTGMGGAVLALDDGACAGGDLVRKRTRVRVLTGLRPADFVVLVTISVVWDTPLDCHFSAWSRPKLAPDPLPGPSVASGVIPTKGGRNGVLQPPAGRAPQGRWRSSPWKRCNHAAPRGRVREHLAPLGVLRLPPRLGLHLCGQQVGERPAPSWRGSVPFALRVIRAWTGRD